MGFTKLFSDILCSSIWNEDDKTRIVWITLLAMKGPNNIARASMDGLAHQARVSVDDCEKAVRKLSEPDRYSGDPEFDGRRIEQVNHGWLILNGEKYRLRRDEEDRKEYMATYMRQYRKRKQSKLLLAPVNTVSPSEADTDKNQKKIREEEEKTSFSLSASPPKTKQSFPRLPENKEQCIEFVTSHLKLSQADGVWLWDHWSGNGFKVNGKPMVSWKHTARSWRTQNYFPSLKPAKS